MNLEIARPLYLILLPVIIAALIISGRFLRLKSNGKKIKYIVIRALVMSLLVASLSGVSVKWTADKTTTIFLVDASDSVANNKEAIKEYVRKVINDMPDKNMAGVVTFGSDTAVEQFVTDKKLFSEFSASLNGTATNIEQGITAAKALFPEDSAKRIVLITDGAENEGNMNNLASVLMSENIEFDVIKLDQSLGDEVYISDLSIPDSINIGDKFNVTATIRSNVATNAIVRLYSGRTLKAEEYVHLNAGENQFVFNDVGDEGGLKSYRVVVEPEVDTNTVNNEYCAFTQVEAKPRVLLVEGMAGQGDEFAKILDANGYLYDKVTPSGVPNTISELNVYKTVILLDVYYDDFRSGFPETLESFVKDYAGGVVCIGGENSFALGNYRDTPIENLLPVYMDLQGEKEIPKMAMAMVIDHSGSMSSPSTDGTNVTGLDLAKQAAIAGLDSLRSTDEVGVLVFDDGYDWAVPLQLASDIEGTTGSISTIGYGGGTSIYPALEEAAKQLEASDAKIKHIILLTDGQDYYNQYSVVTDRIINDGITLSCVAVGADADTQLMSNLAETCGGRYYYTDVDNGIPRIFAQEVYLSVDSYLVNQEFTPVITSNSEITDEILKDGCPTLLGYIASSPKENSKVILESPNDDPILTTWQYGLGKTVAWNSDGTNQWTSNWASWSEYSAFWKNVIDSTISNTDLGDDTLSIVQGGSKATITYGTEDYTGSTKVSGVCTLDNGETIDITFDPVAPGQFESNIDLSEVGVYSISLRNQDGDKVVKSINTATAMQYSPEYRFVDDTEVIDRFTEAIDGNMITMDDDVFGNKISMVKSRVSLTLILLISALILFMIDVITRRLNTGYIEGAIDKIKEKQAAKKERKAMLKKQADIVMANSAVSKVSAVNMRSQQNNQGPTMGTTTTNATTPNITTVAPNAVINTASVANSVNNANTSGKTKVKPVKESKKPKKPKKEEPKGIDTQALLKKKDDRQF